MNRLIPSIPWLPALGLAFLVLAVSCARPGRPEGGPRDLIPPMVVSTWPDTFEVIEPTRDPAVIRFNERISERPTQGSLESAVVVSPETGETRVKHTRAGLEISVIGGFQPDLVYRIRVLPTIKDLFNNTMEGPFELVFSTGAQFQKNVIAGIARDRITEEPAPGIRVVASPEEGAENPPGYVATTDTAGIFALRYLPAGTYNILFFEDVNRNREADFRELQGSAEGTLTAPDGGADTLIIRDVTLLRPDTTPARLLRAEVRDSVLIQLAFDDYLDPDAPLDQVSVQLTREEGTSPDIERLLWQHQLDSLNAFRDSVRAEEERTALTDSLTALADSLDTAREALLVAGDSLAADSLQTRVEMIRSRLVPPEPDEEARPQREEEPEPILPEQFFYVLLGEPMEGNVLYQLVVTGVVNINGVPGGGGDAGVTWTPPELPEEGADTSAALPDTGSVVPPDTGTVVSPRPGATVDSLDAFLREIASVEHAVRRHWPRE